jgi:glutamate N-acetyltransferase/amino-acid N-acetyltransferase
MKLDVGPAPPPIRGFRFAGVHGGLKTRGRRDFALIATDRPAAAAAVFTSNLAAAAPVIVARENAGGGSLQAIMINSGNANAATGEKGLKFARWSCRELGSRLGIDPKLVLPCSTGVIGIELEKIPFSRAISLAVDGLSKNGFGAAARAIMTSDAFAKWSQRTVALGGSNVTVAGMAKGAGMIQPHMATMLAFVLTDADLTAAAADRILRSAVARSFNRITVDGDTSTNDTCVLMASGQAGGGRIEGPESAGYDAMESAVTAVMDELSRMIVRDGEGATKMVDVVVEGAVSVEAADRIARSIGNSPLFKCALAGADPNWGRIVMAVGKAGVPLDTDNLDVDVDDVVLARGGTLVSAEAQRMARKVMRQDAFTLRVRVGEGPGTAVIVTSDLTESYVRFNTAYTT